MIIRMDSRHLTQFLLKFFSRVCFSVHHKKQVIYLCRSVWIKLYTTIKINFKYIFSVKQFYSPLSFKIYSVYATYRLPFQKTLLSTFYFSIYSAFKMTAKATGVSDYGISFLRNQNHVSKNFYQDYVSNVEINIVTAKYYRPLYLDRKKQNVLEDK